jgi:DNA repair protein RecN (Recombination protein N)
MLVSLSVHQFVIVERLELDIARGFTVMTGETGAGKSILIDALDLILGGRADTSVIREGAAKADLSACFDSRALGQIQDWLIEAGLENDDEAERDTLLIRRTVETTGKSRAWINGKTATLSQLKELGEHLVDIHGQHAHQALLRPNAQRQLLDAHAGLQADVKALAEIWRQRQKIQQTLSQAEQQSEQLQAVRDQLEWKIDEIESLKLHAGEWESLSEEQKRLSHAAELMQTAQAALASIDEEENSLLSQTERFAQRLSALTDKDPRISEAAQAVQATAIQFQEAVSALQKYLDRTDLDPERLAEVESRVEAIFTVARKLKTKPEALVDVLDDARGELANAQAAADVAQLQKQLAAHDAEFQKRARTLSKARQKACDQISTAVNQWFEQLAMGAMVFQAVCEPREQPAAFGIEDVVFTLRNHAAGAPFPIHKVASGGELARISLAIAVVTSAANDIPTLIFDEVDTGIGGNVAHTVGKLLRQLGENRQVLCVTHLPQVASRGHHHFRITKRAAAKGSPISELTALDAKERVDEIARMLGNQGTEKTSREHARSLLALDEPAVSR